MKFKFENYNANPFKKKTGDCVIRAICVALKEEWKDTYKGMYDVAVETGYAISCKENYKEYLLKKGYKMQKMPKRDDGKKYTVKEFIEEVAEPNKNYIIKLTHHLTCVKNGKLIDIWDCSRRKVGNYWVV